MALEWRDLRADLRVSCLDVLSSELGEDNVDERNRFSEETLKIGGLVLVAGVLLVGSTVVINDVWYSFVQFGLNCL